MTIAYGLSGEKKLLKLFQVKKLHGKLVNMHFKASMLDRMDLLGFLQILKVHLQEEVMVYMLI